MPHRRAPLIELLKVAYPSKTEKELVSLIMRGDVYVNGEPVEKPRVRVDSDSAISLREKSPFVSRGGEKLACALDAWNIDCAGTVWVDAGCSTGGFTDCLLSRGATLVYAVDVGMNQLHWRLRTDTRVVAMEGKNIMDLRPADFGPAPHRAVADLSFRSLRRAAWHLLGLTTERWGVFLVKPQFEWTEPSREFRGIVREPRTFVLIVQDLVDGLASEGVRVEKAVLSPVRGRKGNRELLFLLRRGQRRSHDISAKDLERIVFDRWDSWP